jgi:hypothetical protein
MNKHKITWLDILYGFASIEGGVIILLVVGLVVSLFKH